MNAFAWIAEQRIREAMAEGLFDDLPYRGQPVPLDDDEGIPPDLRLAFKVLKNARCLPPEIELRREIASLSALLDAVVDPGERARVRRALNDRTLRLALLRGRR